MATQRNEGEGTKTAERQFNRAQKQFAESGKVEPAARDAEKALDTEEGRRLREAENKGRSHSHGEDPALKR